MEKGNESFIHVNVIRASMSDQELRGMKTNTVIISPLVKGRETEGKGGGGNINKCGPFSHITVEPKRSVSEGSDNDSDALMNS